MKRFIFLIMCFFSCLNTPLKANEDLIKLFHLAVESGDVKLVTEIIDALLKDKNNSKNLLDALAKYSEQGKIDFALHNAIQDKNILASVILTHYSKNVNTRINKQEIVWINQNAGAFRDSKTPLELAFEANMIGLIPYLLMKNADPYLMSRFNFFYEGEENPDYMKDLGCDAQRKVCVKSKKAFVFFPIASPQRTFIGYVIANNRLDVIELLHRIFKIDLNKICYVVMGRNYTPLQLALAIKRYEIAQFLIDHGARIE